MPSPDSGCWMKCEKCAIKWDACHRSVCPVCKLRREVRS